MLSFDIRALHVNAATVAGEMVPDDPAWQEADLLPSKPISVTGRLSTAGDDRFYFSGHLQGTAVLSCSRCLEPVSVDVAEPFNVIFAEVGGEDDEDPDVFPVDPGAAVLDMRSAIREHWLLIVPRFAVCREDCKGLCPRCGADLNRGPCNCEPATDSRWDALRSIRPK